MAVGESGGRVGEQGLSFTPFTLSNQEPLYDTGYDAYLTSYHNQLNSAQAEAANFDQFQVANMADWADIHPGASPGIVTSMGATGIDPLSDQAMSFAQADAERTAPNFPTNRPGAVVQGQNQNLLSPQAVELQELMSEANAVGLVNDNGNITHPGSDAPQALLDTFNDVAELHEQLGQPFWFESDGRLLAQDWQDDRLRDFTEVDPADPETFSNLRDVSEDAEIDTDARISELQTLLETLGDPDINTPREFWDVFQDSGVTMGDYLSAFGLGSEADPEDTELAFLDQLNSGLFAPMADEDDQRTSDLIDIMIGSYVQLNAGSMDDEQLGRWRERVSDPTVIDQALTTNANPDFLNAQVRDVIESNRNDLPDISGDEWKLGQFFSNASNRLFEGDAGRVHELFDAAIHDVNRAVEPVGEPAISAVHHVGEPVIGQVPETARDVIGRLTRGTVRTTMLVADSILQELQNTSMEIATGRILPGVGPDPGEEGFGGVESEAQIAMEQLLSGEEVDIGSGWLPDPEGSTRTERNLRLRDVYGERGGHTPTLGRMAASAAGVSPDSAQWDMLSGTVDFGVTLLDPTMYMGRATGRGFLPDLAQRPTTPIDLPEALRTAPTPSAVLPARFETPPTLPTHLRDPSIPSAAPQNRGTVGISPELLNSPGVPRPAPTLNLARQPPNVLTNPSPPEPQNLFQRIYHSGGRVGRSTGADPVRATAWLNSDHGRRVVNAIAEEPSPSNLWRLMSRRDPDLARQLADVSDPETVAQVLQSRLGTTFRHTDEVYRRTMFERARRRGRSNPVRRFLRNLPTGNTIPLQNLDDNTVRRWVHQIPYDRVDLQDPNINMAQMERWAANLSLDDNAATFWGDRMARATSAPARYKAWTDFFGQEALPRLTDAGVDPEVATRATRMFRDDVDTLRNYMTDERANPLRLRSVMGLDNKMIDVPAPSVSAELAEGTMLMPDWRIARRELSPFRNLLASSDGELRSVAQKLVAAQAKWKPWAMVRPAYVLRVIPEEQGRMYVAGYDTMFNSPLAYISWLMMRRRDRRLGDALTESAEYKRAMVSNRRDYFTPESNELRARMSGDMIFRKGRDTNYDTAWLMRLNLLHNSDEVRYLAQNGMDETVNWMVHGDGRYILKRFQQAGYGEFSEQAARGRLIPTRNTEALEIQVRDYLENHTQKAISSLTGDNPDLIAAIRTGRIGDQPFTVGADGFRPNSSAARALNPYHDWAPAMVSGPELVRTQADNYRNKAVDMAFDSLVAVPQDFLDRSPVYFQAYWTRMREMSPFASNKALREAADLAAAQSSRTFDNIADLVPSENLQSASNFRLTRNFRRDMTRRQGRVPTGDDLSFAEMDLVAKQFGVDEVKRLLFDNTRRGQVMDSMRLMFPFGDAWAEVMTTWSKLLRMGEGARPAAFLPNPKAVRLGHAADEIANGEMVSGEFREGEFGTVFEYPMSSVLSSAVTGGSPVPLVGYPDGLSMMTNVTPGLGPVMQIPAAYILRSRPQDDELRELLLPFGAPFDEDEPLQLANPLNYAPPWLKNLATAGFTATIGGEDMFSDRQYGNAYGEFVRSEMSSGRWDLSDPSEVERMHAHVESRLPGWFLMRAVGASTLPASPQPEWTMHGPDENTVTTWVMQAQLRQLQEEHGFDDGNDLFIEQYGDWLYSLTTLSGTESRLPGRLPITEEFRTWVDANPDLQANYSNVYHLLFPGDPSGQEISHSLMQRQLARGERVRVPPTDWAFDANASAASRVYNEYRRQVGPNPEPEQTAWLASIRDELREAYPGWRGAELTSDAPIETLMHEVEQAAQDPAVSSTDMGWAINEYLTARDQVLIAQRDAEFEAAGVSHAAELKPLRDWLHMFGIALGAEVPAFQNLFDTVLERELPEEEMDPGAEQWYSPTRRRQARFSTTSPAGDFGTGGGFTTGGSGFTGGLTLGGAA